MRMSSSFAISILVLLQSLLVQSCGGSGNGSSQSASGASNRARFVYDCNLNGVNGVLSMDVEAIGSTGVVFGPGPNPEITGVIGTGDFTYYSAGTLTSATAFYTFTGENSFADFTDNNTFDRFRVQWVLADEGLVMVVNPFGPQPTQHGCRLNNSFYF